MSILYSIIIIAICCAAFVYPTAGAIAYIWHDQFNVLNFAKAGTEKAPLSYILAVSIISGAALNFNKLRRPTCGIAYLLLLYLGLITFNTYHAIFQEAAWAKYESSAKSIIMMLLISTFITNRIRVEAMAWAFILSNLFLGSTGIAGLLSGRDIYGISDSLIVGSIDRNFVAARLLAAIPLVWFLAKNSSILRSIPFNRFTASAAGVIIFLEILASYSRGAVIGLIVMSTLYALLARRLRSFFIALFFALISVAIWAPNAWLSRMKTIDINTEESSALSRIASWEWAIEFASRNPMGGGFGAYLANTQSGKPVEMHSFIFETLAEQGWLGLTLYLILIFYTSTRLFRIRRAAMKSDDEWLKSLSTALIIAGGATFSAGLFINNANQTSVFFLFMIAICAGRPSLARPQMAIPPKSEVLRSRVSSNGMGLRK
jgi:putative inorganic carbon (HCO3(-)) transporter